MLQTILSVILFILLMSAYTLLFPSRVGDTSRISFVDRVALGFRLFFARVELTIAPIRSSPKIHCNNSSGIPPIGVESKKLFFDSAENALAGVLLTKKRDEPSCYYFSGFAATESPFLWFKALESCLAANSNNNNSDGHKNITVISQTGSSLRNVGNISLDHLIASSPPGTIKRVIAGHLETCHLTLKRAEEEDNNNNNNNNNSLEIYNIPLGVISRLVGLQASSTSSTCSSLKAKEKQEKNFGPPLVTSVGVGTFLENNTGCGHKITPKTCTLNLVERVTSDEGEVTKLSYKIPNITVAFIHAKTADNKGNLYFNQNTVIGDAIDAAIAAKKNGGKVFASVEQILSEDDELLIAEATLSPSTVLKSIYVDAIVVVNSVLHHDYSGLAKHCTRSHRQGLTINSLCEYWETASIAWGLATTFHSRRRNTDRHNLPMITHCHDEIVKLCQLFVVKESKVERKSKEDQTNVIRIIVGVSVPEMVAMTLTEDLRGLVFTDVENNNKNSSSKSAATRTSSSSLGSERFPIFTENNKQQQKLPPIQFLLESGVMGGLPAPGFLFGNSFNPYKICRGPEFWNAVNNNKNKNSGGINLAQMCILGAGEVDVYGNVNVSHASGSAAASTSSKNSNNNNNNNSENENDNKFQSRSIIGCGGFPDICEGVSFAIVFVLSLASSGTRFERPHGYSIVNKVSQVTFSPKRALLERKCEVRYCTEFGVFKAELWRDEREKDEEKRLKTRLVAPPGLEMLIQEKCKVELFL